jgi:hypothetical protein
MDDLGSEIDEFDLKPSDYHVLLQAFDAEGDPQYIGVVHKCKQPKQAIEKAKELVRQIDKTGELPVTTYETARVVVISVETVVQCENEELHVGTLFIKTLIMKDMKENT